MMQMSGWGKKMENGKWKMENLTTLCSTSWPIGKQMSVAIAQ